MKLQEVIHAFKERCSGIAGVLGDAIHVFDNPTEELIDGVKRRKAVNLYAGGQMLAGQTGAKARLEENYLYDTRLIPATIVAGDNLFFQSAIGLSGQNNGFAAALVMSDLETNMDTPGQIAQGKNFVFNQVGVSFNADITAGNASLLLETGALRFSKQGGQYTLKHGPIKLWPGGTGVATDVAAVTTSGSSNGVPDLRASRKIAIPRIIREKESFNYSFVIPRAVRNLDNSTAITLSVPCTMTVWLWGGQQDNIPV